MQGNAHKLRQFTDYEIASDEESIGINSNDDKFIIKKNPDISLLVELFKSKAIGETVTFDEMISIVYQKDEAIVRKRASDVKRKILNDGFAFISDRNVGYKRAEADELVEDSPKNIKSARRKITRNVKSLHLASDEDLNKDMKIVKDAQLVCCGVLLHLSTDRQMKKIQQKSMNNTLTFNPKETLKYLTGS
jgi:hypothetical protein